jgi:hypothetical protein
MASRQLLIPRILAAGTSFSPLPCQAWHGYGVTGAYRVEVEIGADGPASAPPSGAAAAAPPAGAERSKDAMLMDHIARCPCSSYVIQLYDRIVHVLEEVMLEAGVTKGRFLRLEVPRTRSGAFRDRPRDVV